MTCVSVKRHDTAALPIFCGRHRGRGLGVLGLWVWRGCALLLFRDALARAVVFGYAVAMNCAVRDLVVRVSAASGALCDRLARMFAAGVCGRVGCAFRPFARRRRYAAGSAGGGRGSRDYARDVFAAFDGGRLRNGGGRRRPFPRRPARAYAAFAGQPRHTQRLRRGFARASARQAPDRANARRALPLVFVRRSPAYRFLHPVRAASACPLRPGNPAAR